MTDKSTAPRGRPIKNKVERIPATPERIASAIFRAAEQKNAKSDKPKKKKPN